MQKTVIAIVFFLFLSRAAVAQVSADSILTILQMKQGREREKRLILSIRYYFGDKVNRLDQAKATLNGLLVRYPVPDLEATKLLAETLYQMEKRHNIAAEQVLVRAIGLGDRAENHDLLYACFTQLGFLQSLKGNTTEAISSFRQAKKEATTLSDPYLQVLINVNISDIYYRNGLYNSSLIYLDECQELLRRFREPRFRMMVWVNKAENYFRMGQADSLAKYAQLLNGLDNRMPGRYTYQQRTGYYLELLKGHYDIAIIRLTRLRNEPDFLFNQADALNLADAYFYRGQLDSARAIASRLLANPAQNNHPEVKLYLYELLGRIAMRQNNQALSALNFSHGLIQAKEQLARLIRVDTISARLRLDEMQNRYIRREEGLTHQRLWLIFAVIVTILTLVAGYLQYRNIRQKRRFEQLFFVARQEELSFINSHEVRRHLANILGIIDTIRESEHPHEAYGEAEAHLLQAAEQLDAAIKNIAGKLDY